MKNCLICVDDDPDNIDGTIQTLDLPGVNIVPLTSHSGYMKARNKINPVNTKYAYLIDLHLGFGIGIGGQDGFDILDDLKERDPNAIKIVYTAYPEKTEECMTLGASLVLKKGGKSQIHDAMICRILQTYFPTTSDTKSIQWKQTISPLDGIVTGESHKGYSELAFPTLPDKRGNPLQKMYPSVALENFTMDDVVRMTMTVNPGIIQTIFKLLPDKSAKEMLKKEYPSDLFKYDR